MLLLVLLLVPVPSLHPSSHIGGVWPVQLLSPSLHGGVGVVGGLIGGGAIVLLDIVNIICKIKIIVSKRNRNKKRGGLRSPSNHLMSSCL